MPDTRSPGQLLEDTMLYGLCETCRAPRATRVERRGRATFVLLWCPRCGEDAD